MEYFSYRHPKNNCRVTVSWFAAPGFAAEFHLCVAPPRISSFVDQLGALEEAYGHAMEEQDLDPNSAVLRRFFLSDIANQEALLRRSEIAQERPGDQAVAISIIEETPMESQVAMWAYHIQDATPLKKDRRGNTVSVKRDSGVHLWTTGLASPPAPGQKPDAATQTAAIFEAYAGELENMGAGLRDEVIRTWVFVRNIEKNYDGMVSTRREFFARHGLTKDTHFIASTGIEGGHADSRCLVMLDAYAVAGIDPRRIRFLSAPGHLGPTSAYGVTFERGTRVDYGDRTHLLISGTASINPAGQIVHPGDVAKQSERTCENVSALLADADAGTEDVAQMIVYIRDAADRQAVQDILDKRFPGAPSIILRAAVCRPGWLVEIECLAVKTNRDPRFPPF